MPFMHIGFDFVVRKLPFRTHWLRFRVQKLGFARPCPTPFNQMGIWDSFHQFNFPQAEIVPPKGFGASLTGQICIALVITSGIVLALILFAFQTNYDYTGIGSYLNFGMMALMIFGIIGISPMDPRPILRGKGLSRNDVTFLGGEGGQPKSDDTK